MNVAIRTDSSTQIGTGHIMRCITLGDRLRGRGTKVSFICRELPGNICDVIEGKGYTVHRLPYSEQVLDGVKSSAQNLQQLGVSWEVDSVQTKDILAKEEHDINWLVVDHYALDERWEASIRPHVKSIMVIDDLANRPHDCDLLLDQNLYENMEHRYEGLVPGHCQKLLGPKYALLRPEFNEARKCLRERDGHIKRILIFFGGSDPTNETTKALEAIRLLDLSGVIVDVVVGAANPYKDDVRWLCANMLNVEFYCQVENMAQLMASADLAISSGGSTTWERCFMGLPTIALVVAQNQLKATEAVAAAGAAWNLGWSKNVSVESLADNIKKALVQPAAMKEMGLAAMQLMNNGSSCEAGDHVLISILEENDAKAGRL